MELRFEKSPVKDSNKWLLAPKELLSDDPYFTFESDFGEKRPRIIRGKSDKVFLTCKDD